MLTAETIIAHARETIGTPFAHQGRLCGIALDCAGVAAYVAKCLGVEFNEWPGYGRIPHQGLLESVMDAQPCLDRVYSQQSGDILLMKFTGEPQHVAIYAGETIIHAYETIGKVVEHRLDAVWLSRIVRIYRFKGVE